MTVSGIQGAMSRVNQILASVPGAQPAPPPAAAPASGANGNFASQLQAAQRAADPAGVKGAPGAAAIPGPGSSATGMRMLQIAQTEVGQGESPKGSNDGPDIRRFRLSNPVTGPGDPWCSTWVSHLAANAGSPLNGKTGMAWVPDVEAHGKKIGTWMPSGGGTPSPGDIIVFDRNGDGLSDHIGIIERVNADGSVGTIEGNTGTNDVARRSYGKGEWYGTLRLP